MRGCKLALAAVTALACVGAAAPAGATPQQDFNATYADWKPDGDITACRFSRQELENAYAVATGSPDFRYATGYTDELNREIARWKSGGCAGVSPLSLRKRSALYGAKIVAVSGRGTARAEYVKIRNGSRKTLSFRKATLWNARKDGAYFPARFKLRPGKTAVVHVGCAKGRRRASFRRLGVYLCLRRQLFRDRGDAARLVDAKGITVSQRAYGTEMRRVSY